MCMYMSWLDAGYFWPLLYAVELLPGEFQKCAPASIICLLALNIVRLLVMGIIMIDLIIIIIIIIVRYAIIIIVIIHA